MKLSVLVPTIPSRAHFLARILGILGPQLTEDVQVLVNMDACSRTISEKRNALLNAAEGDYVIFCDDDDLVSADYIEQLMVGISLGVDVVSIRGEVKRDGFDFGVFVDTPYQRLQNIKQEDGTFLCLRGTQHLDAIKRGIALQQQFEVDRNFGEDSRWTAELEAKKLVHSWHLVPVPIYTYLWVVNKVRPTQTSAAARARAAAQPLPELRS